ncbi:superoxide dismutase family protein [Sphingomonas sp. GCM10030256]|uniref:superoxide dismutase family protein n=1 Tax=Sphingomonas sp. GCM10030256 TaxID=3273427 RepID=UPI00361C45A9
MIRPVLCLAASALALTACNQREEARDVLNIQNDAQAVPVNGATETFGTSTTGAGQIQSVPLRTADGRQVGSASMREEGGATIVTASVTGMPQGTYGMHIHAVGKCEGPKFESAGEHWNPGQKKHGKNNPQGAHAGDLDNLTVGQAGSGGATVNLAEALRGGLTPVLDENGAALVIHAKADDYRTDPSGNSGDRIACAILGSGAEAPPRG